MKIRTLAQIFALSGAAVSFAASQGFAGQGSGQGYCRHIGGGILTNFLDPSQCLPTSGSSVGLCTDGPATGDLLGAVGVQVLAVNGNVYHNRHHWVTESGDTITFEDADLTTFPTGDSGRVVADYLKGITITGGTGGFKNAHGFLDSVFGAIDLNKLELTLRYEGYVCFAPVNPG